MPYAVNAMVSRIEAPPILEALSWIEPGLRNRKLLNLSQAVPSYPPAPALDAEAARLAREPGISLYTDILGIPDLREALARHMSADYRSAIRAEETCITAGCNQAFSAAIMALAKQGDNAIVPVPYFFNHTMWLSMLGIEARFIPAMGGGNPWPDPEDAARLIDGNTRAIILCSPNNPTGSIYPPQAIDGFFDLARQRGIALVIDETYKDFRTDPAPAHNIFSRPDWQDTYVQLYSFSKVLSFTGYRIGSIVAGKPLLDQVEKILDCMSICACHLSQRTALFGLTSLGQWRAEKTAAIGERLMALRKAFRRPGLSYELISSGALFAFAKHPFRGVSAKAVAQRLAKEFDVICLPGSMFGPDQEDYLRIAFAAAEAGDMETLVDRLIDSQG